MRFLIKLAIIVFIIYLAIKYAGIGKSQVTYIMNLSGNVVTQQEVRSICSMIYSEFAIDGMQFPNGSESFWTEYIRSNMDTQARGRERGCDIWQTPYKVIKSEDVSGRGRPGFMVISAGPDKTFETIDDIRASAAFSAD